MHKNLKLIFQLIILFLNKRNRKINYISYLGGLKERTDRNENS